MSETGLPLLSGPPSPIENLRVNTSACRKCNKEFNVLFSRQRKCQHCGYLYCTACSDYQAIMPRYKATSSATAGVSSNAHAGITGYDVVNVCAFCSEFLQITAGGKNYLKSLSLAKLKKYANAYDIRIDRAVEKDDIIEAILNARGHNGCLPSENERFYRKYSVPDRTAGGSARPRGLFARSGDNAPTRVNNDLPPRPPQQSRPEFPRPDLEPDPPTPSPQQHQQEYPHQHHYQHQHSNYQYQHNQSFNHTPQPPSNHTHRSSSYSHPSPNYHSPPPPPPPPPPPHPEHHWGRSPYVHNSYHTTWGYPPEPDYYNYGTLYTSHPPPPPPTSTRPSPPQPHHHTHPPPPPPPPPPHPPRPASTRRRSQSQSQPQSNNQNQASNHTHQSTSTPPTLDTLLSMSPNDIRSLSIATLKSILFSNHVNANAMVVLEKSDLVSRVLQLVEDEKKERERAQRANDEEYREMIRDAQRESQAQQQEEEEEERRQSIEHQEREQGQGQGQGPDRQIPSPPHSVAPIVERGGLCVVCQDEEANIAIVDCGHLAMCRTCSDLVMSSSRECPLCRTRIVTEARLLRIFKS